MRTTKASSAVERLIKRSNNVMYSMRLNSKGLFSLMLQSENGDAERVCEPMMMDDFVAFVNAHGPQTPKRASKLEVAFSEQLVKKAGVKR